MKTKNPFRGIAHSNGSSYNQKYFRHIEGARDTRPAHKHLWNFEPRKPFRDINPVPVSFCE